MTTLDQLLEQFEKEFPTFFEGYLESGSSVKIMVSPQQVEDWLRTHITEMVKGAVREVIEKIEFEIGNYEKIPEWQEIKRMFAGDKQEVIIHFLEWYNKKQLELLATLREEKEEQK